MGFSSRQAERERSIRFRLKAGRYIYTYIHTYIHREEDMGLVDLMHHISMERQPDRLRRRAQTTCKPPPSFPLFFFFLYNYNLVDRKIQTFSPPIL